MEIILKKNVKGLGYKDDVVDVKPGYGRNFLIPHQYAIIANQTNKKILVENKKQAAHKAEKLKADAESKAQNIEKLALVIKTKAGESGKIFGAITAIQISDALKSNGVDVDRKQISLPESVKEIGEYVADIDLHRDVKTSVKFSVVAE